MVFPLTQDAELDFDAYFSLESEKRLAILMEILSPGITKEGQEDLATIRDRITEKHHDIIKQRKKDKSIPEPTLMQELFTALSAGVKSMQTISDTQREQIDAQKLQRAGSEQQKVYSAGEGMDVVDTQQSSQVEKKTKKKRRHRCIIC